MEPADRSPRTLRAHARRPPKHPSGRYAPGGADQSTCFMRTYIGTYVHERPMNRRIAAATAPGAPTVAM
jgi:hypothetical protein